MAHQSLNVLISSKHRHLNEEISNVNYALTSGLIKCRNDEYLTVSLKNFSMIKSFFAVIPNVNNAFKISFVDPDNQITNHNFYLSEGFYSIDNLIKDLNDIVQNNIYIAEAQISFQYNENRNSIIVKKNISDGRYYFTSINCGILVGCDDNIQYEITESGEELPSFVNLSGHSNLIIEISGDVNLEASSINNVIYNDFKSSQVLGIINLNDIPFYSLIDASNCNEYKISNKAINNINIRIINENGLEFKRLSNYVMNLEFKTYSLTNRTTILRAMNRLEMYLSRIFVLIGNFISLNE